MTYHYVTANSSSFNSGTGDTIYEAAGVTISGGVDMRYQSNDTTFNGGGSQIVYIYGGVFGSFDDYGGATSGNDQFYIGPTGYVAGTNAFELNGGGNTIVNNGSIAAASYPYAIYMIGSSGANTSGTDLITNTGVMSGTAQTNNPSWGVIQCQGIASIIINNSGSILAGLGSDSMTISGSGTATISNSGNIVGLMQLGLSLSLANVGTISGSINAQAATINNAGAINGNITISSGLINSAMGSVQGLISTGGAATVIAGQTGGTVSGGGGADIFYANPTQTAANDAAQTTLDGGGGVNALYGDGAYTTFLSGDATYNQIWGEASQMAGVVGYANNTLSYANAGTGVYVDLLNGHDAYIASASGQAWTGTGTYEDSIANVPNVVGSKYGDVIQCDSGVDVVTGGGGGDLLYAGTGASSQDTFVYGGYSDSNLVAGYDTISGFRTGVDKIDLSAFHSNGLHLSIYSTPSSTDIYLEATPGTLNAATDLAISVVGANAVKASDVIF